MGSSVLSAAIAAARAELEVEPADTPDLVKEAHRLRHQVYCLERGYKPAQNGLEFDGYDSHSRHVVLRLAATGTVIGTARLVLPHAAAPWESFPAQSVCAPECFAGLPFARTAEVSRFSISKERRGLSTAATSLSRLALVRGLVQLSGQQGITHWCAVMERTLLRLLRGSGIHFQSLGPMVEYYGLRQPAFCNVADMLARMRVEHPDAWGFVTEHGAFVAASTERRLAA